MAKPPSRPKFAEYPIHDDLRMSHLVEEGLPAAAVAQISDALGLAASNLAPIVNINRKTLNRRLASRGRLKPAESERVARVMRIFVRALEVFEDADKARVWLNRPLELLGGAAPLALLATEQGAREVEQVLGRLEHGVFA